MNDTIVAIPVYNEEKNIGRTIKLIRKTGFGGTILVINDGSTDNTALIARESGAEVISFKKNQGKASAVFAAFKEGLRRNANALITFDADMLEIPKKDFEALASEAKKATAEKRTLMFVAFTRERSGFDWLSADISGIRSYSRNAMQKIIHSPYKGKVKGFGIEAFLNLELGERETSMKMWSRFVAGPALRLGERQEREISQTLKALKKRVIAVNERRRAEMYKRFEERMKSPQSIALGKKINRAIKEAQKRYKGIKF
jgi:glycosyltransferase involved in cell wall biosynthesis